MENHAANSCVFHGFEPSDNSLLSVVCTFMVFWGFERSENAILASFWQIIDFPQKTWHLSEFLWNSFMPECISGIQILSIENCAWSLATFRPERNFLPAWFFYTKHFKISYFSSWRLIDFFWNAYISEPICGTRKLFSLNIAHDHGLHLKTANVGCSNETVWNFVIFRFKFRTFGLKTIVLRPYSVIPTNLELSLSSTRLLKDSICVEKSSAT